MWRIDTNEFVSVWKSKDSVVTVVRWNVKKVSTTPLSPPTIRMCQWQWCRA